MNPTTPLLITALVIALSGCAERPQHRPEIAADPVQQAVIRYFDMTTAEHDR